ncbi:hypothetical protein ACVNRM_23810 [Bacillus paranthracis]|uniref:hypothetical protein n=2 Tax=Bacillaceae TaxID=186817 RepID=UPI0007728CB7|nr:MULTISPECIES: hypothetical protein [Bacillus]KXI52724.1 hypothetical protein ACS45_10150 [Bacillus cereus]MDA1509339.1 hypothetical protein [Bacillus cereus group sp. TH36-2LC]MDA1790952.1 hypothetical protein [Bacillus cereus group sp. BY5-1LC]
MKKITRTIILVVFFSIALISMNKITRTIILVVFFSIALISMNKIAQATDNSKESPEKIALKDYQNSKGTLLKDGKQLHQNHNFTSNSTLEISTFFSMFMKYNNKTL